MNRLGRAWAALRGREDPGYIAHLQYCLEQAHQRLMEVAGVQGEHERCIASLRASLTDANATITRLSAENSRRVDLLRMIAAEAERGVANPGEPT